MLGWEPGGGIVNSPLRANLEGEKGDRHKEEKNKQETNTQPSHPEGSLVLILGRGAAAS